MLYDAKDLIAYGPVPSRRLGQSLGINNIPPKHCTYSCIYCQVGGTKQMCYKRREFFQVYEIEAHVERRILQAKSNEERIDYLSFVPDGEPTLDVNIGREIERLKRFDIPIAVITNASLLWRNDVREELSQADWVSVKIDAVTPTVWNKINHPHRMLAIEKILEGITAFSQEYHGTLTTETMIMNMHNNQQEEVTRIAQFLATLNAHKNYISVPTRPPTDRTVCPPTEDFITQAYHIFQSHGLDTECIIHYEGNSFAYTDDIESTILGITSVHPIREEAMSKLLIKAGRSWDIVISLLSDNKLRKTIYQGDKYYIRKLYQ